MPSSVPPPLAVSPACPHASPCTDPVLRRGRYLLLHSLPVTGLDPLFAIGDGDGCVLHRDLAFERALVLLDELVARDTCALPRSPVRAARRR